MKQAKNFKYKINISTSADDFYVMSTAESNEWNSGVIRINSNSNAAVIDHPNGKYSIFDIANWFLLKSDMTHKKMQKLCYYAQAWCYALKGYRLANTDFQAWVHGPVSPALYERFKCFGYETIKINTKYELKLDTDDIVLLEDIWDTYGDKTGNALEALSHRELPWMEARRGYAAGERCTVVINPNTMCSFYRSIYTGEN